MMGLSLGPLLCRGVKSASPTASLGIRVASEAQEMSLQLPAAI